jgi:hypothetical protein
MSNFFTLWLTLLTGAYGRDDQLNLTLTLYHGCFNYIIIIIVIIIMLVGLWLQLSLPAKSH